MSEEMPLMGKRDDFADLVERFETSAKNSIDSYQESGPRKISITSVYCDSQSGIACLTDEQGIPHLIATKSDPGAQGMPIKQRFFLGIQTEVVTKDNIIKSENLKGKKAKAPKPFDITPQVDQLLKAAIPAAQDAGDRIQRRIDEENYEWFPIAVTPPEKNTVALDTEEHPDAELIMDLVSFARGEVADKLGAKADKIDVQFVKIVEHRLYADSLGARLDYVFPRVSFVIQVKTKEGNTAFGALRGAGGTIAEILSRYTNEDALPETRESKVVVSKLVDQVVKEATDLDRAQTTTIIGATECPIILAPQVAGVLAHEVFGHTAEADIICENRREKDVGVQLKSRIGSQVSDCASLTIIDTPDRDIDLGGQKLKFNWGALPVDGYGNKGKTVKIIENGTMVGVLIDRHTFNEIVSGLKDPAAIMDLGVTGNVRREKFDCDPLIRMRNTIILPDENGPSSKEEMAQLIPANKKGLYIKSCNGGWVNPDTGDFQITGNLCYLIENRTITDKPVKNVNIRGNIKQISLIKAIGNAKTMHHSFTGWCGKDGQSVPVDGCGPLVYIEKAFIGGGSFKFWTDVVADYQNQHREVKQGKRGPESINLSEIREFIGDKEPQHKVTMVSAILPPSEEIRYLMGLDDYSTHYLSDDGQLIERRDPYE